MDTNIRYKHNIVDELEVIIRILIILEGIFKLSARMCCLSIIKEPGHCSHNYICRVLYMMSRFYKML